MAQKIASLYAEIGADTSKLKRGLNDTKSGLKKTGQQFGDFKNMATGAVAGVTAGIYTMKKALDFGREGAEVAQMGESFDGLMDNLGVTTDLLEELQNESKNTISDFSLMASTATLLAGATGKFGKEMAEATPELMRIAKAANKLNPSLGTTAFMYESISKGIKRSQPLILDNLGLVVKVGDANAVYAAQIGKTVEQLSGEEKQIALLNAALKAGGGLLEQGGGNTNSATDEFDQFSSSVKNAGDELKENLLPYLNNVAAGLNGVLFGTKKVNAAFEEHEKHTRYASNSYQEYGDEIIDVQVRLGEMNEARVESIKRGWEEERFTYESTIEALGGVTEAEFRASRAVDIATNSLGLHTEAMQGINTAGGDTAKSYDELTEAQDRYKESFETLAAAQQSYNEGTGSELETLLGDRLYEGSKKYAEGIGIVDDVYGTTLVAEKEHKDELEKIVTAYANSVIGSEEFRGQLQKLQDQELNDVTKEFMEQVGLVQDLNDKLEALPDEVDIKVNLDVNGDMEILGLSGGGGSSGGDYNYKPTRVSKAPPAQDNRPGFASGGDFVVPGGFPNDTYPMWVSSGEHVTVKTKQQDSGGGQGIHIENINVSGGDSDVAYQIRRELENMMFLRS